MKIAFTFLVVAMAAASAQPVDLMTEQHESKLDWWENGVFYQIYPRSFKDSSGDGIGDIRGVIEKLDYLKELGVSGAWLSPIFKSPMIDFGYDIADFYDVDPTFGTISDLEELFQKANDIGIKIILDFVPNHTSDQSEWFKKSVKREEPYTDFYIWHDGKLDIHGKRQPPNNWACVFYGSAWTWNDERKQFFFHQFATQQPDLNYRNPKVVEEMKNVLRFWLAKGAGGFRIDAVNHLFEVADLRDEPLTGWTNDPYSYGYTIHDYTKDLPEVYEWVYEFRALVDEYKQLNGGPTRILMTEAYTNSAEFAKYYKSADGKRLGSQMPFNFALLKDINQHSPACDYKKAIDDHIAMMPVGTRNNWLVGNHDNPRAASRYGANKVDATLTLVMTLPGIAITYNGEEIGMEDNRKGISYSDTRDPQACNRKENEDWSDASRDPERTPFQWDNSKWAGFSEGETKPWLPIHPNYYQLNLAAQKNVTRSTFKLYKDLVKLREHRTMAEGSFESTVINENVFAYVRALKGYDTMVVLLNLGPNIETINVKALTKDLGKRCQVILAGANTLYDVGDLLPTKSISLQKYEVIIIKKA